MNGRAQSSDLQGLPASAIHESEQIYRLFVESVREYALIQIDGGGIVTTWNPGAERLFGYTSAEMVGQPATRLLTPEDQDARISEVEIERVMQGERVRDERWVVRKDGSRFWAHWVAEPVRDESGRFRGMAKVLRDDTERRRAELAIQESLAEKKALLTDVHHRMKNNLQLIASLISLQSNEVEDRRVSTLLEQTRNRIFSIAAVYKIIDGSREYASMSVAAFTTQFLPELERFHDGRKRIQLRIDDEPGMLVWERAVPFGLLLNELVSNACKHAFPAGGAGEVTVTVGREGDYNILSVTDNGIGPPAGLDYHQARSLGLRLVQMLTQQLGGEVNVVSNAGVRIHVRFPSS